MELVLKVQSVTFRHADPTRLISDKITAISAAQLLTNLVALECSRLSRGINEPQSESQLVLQTLLKRIYSLYFRDNSASEGSEGTSPGSSSGSSFSGMGDEAFRFSMSPRDGAPVSWTISPPVHQDAMSTFINAIQLAASALSAVQRENGSLDPRLELLLGTLRRCLELQRDWDGEPEERGEDGVERIVGVDAGTDGETESQSGGSESVDVNGDTADPSTEQSMVASPGVMAVNARRTQGDTDVLSWLVASFINLGTLTALSWTRGALLGVDWRGVADASQECDAMPIDAGCLKGVDLLLDMLIVGFAAVAEGPDEKASIAGNIPNRKMLIAASGVSRLRASRSTSAKATGPPIASTAPSLGVDWRGVADESQECGAMPIDAGRLKGVDLLLDVLIKGLAAVAEGPDEKASIAGNIPNRKMLIAASGVSRLRASRSTSAKATGPPIASTAPSLGVDWRGVADESQECGAMPIDAGRLKGVDLLLDVLIKGLAAVAEGPDEKASIAGNIPNRKMLIAASGVSRLRAVDNIAAVELAPSVAIYECDGDRAAYRLDCTIVLQEDVTAVCNMAAGVEAEAN
ncbi:hypothetical protein BDK51DRAFT_30612 [Blyttiomyces helicus]|uniref:Uncharacterized protein n=1 Tax=Blyttiomyces helicus TaxID=388810 RepID=A0A4P9WDC0_9FUNG|nr:hypothetical protein BDK51DRAFT_30612 [Blyttiomyces helicus]|eukprot:RKO89653.1 hypothetical protein BDK51DRAFT_30612 [Blyttiomyces helicus]